MPWVDQPKSELAETGALERLGLLGLDPKAFGTQVLAQVPFEYGAGPANAIIALDALQAAGYRVVKA